MTIAMFVLPISEPNRMMGTVSSFLGVISYLFVIVPNVPYSTRLDTFMNFSFFIIAFVLFVQGFVNLLAQFTSAPVEEVTALVPITADLEAGTEMTNNNNNYNNAWEAEKQSRNEDKGIGVSQSNQTTPSTGLNKRGSRIAPLLDAGNKAINAAKYLEQRVSAHGMIWYRRAHKIVHSRRLDYFLATVLTLTYVIGVAVITVILKAPLSKTTATV